MFLYTVIQRIVTGKHRDWEIDEITGEEIGPLYWFHERCLNIT